MGGDFDINAKEQSINKANFAVGYDTPNFSFHGIVSNWAHTFTAGFFQRLDPRFAFGAEVDSHSIAIS